MGSGSTALDSGAGGLKVAAGQAASWGPNFKFGSDVPEWKGFDYSLVQAGASARLPHIESDDSSASSTYDDRSYKVGSKDRAVEQVARRQYGDDWRAGVAAIIDANSLKSNSLGSPIIRVGDELQIPDLARYGDLAMANRAGGAII